MAMVMLISMGFHQALLDLLVVAEIQQQHQVVVMEIPMLLPQPQDLPEIPMLLPQPQDLVVMAEVQTLLPQPQYQIQLSTPTCVPRSTMQTAISQIMELTGLRVTVHQGAQRLKLVVQLCAASVMQLLARTIRAKK